MLTLSENYIVENLGSSIKFSMPCRKFWVDIFGIVFGFFIMLAVLFSWVLNIFIPKEINSPPTPPLPFAFVFALLMVVLFIELLWLLLGIETIEVDENHIVVAHQIFGIGLSKELFSNKIDGVFVSHQNYNLYFPRSKDFKFYYFKVGKVAINYGKTFLGGTKTFRFGTNLDEGEAKQIVRLIHEKFPQYIYKNPPKTG